jgi:mycofactocin precursor
MSELRMAADPEPVPAITTELSEDGEPDEDELLVDDELVIEEISIDGMCGIY